MRFRNYLLVGALVAATSAQSANTGSCYANAASLKGSQTVTLTPEYDKEIYEGYDDSGMGVYYLKIKLARGTAHTIWISGGNAESIDLDVDVNWDAYGDADVFPMATFDVVDYNGGAIKAATITAQDWDEEDPKTVVFYAVLSGDAGMKTTVYYSAGVKSFVQAGEEGSPVSLTMKDSEQTKSAKLIDGEYWFKAKLTDGRLYQVTTTKGTADMPLVITMDGDCLAYPVPTFSDEANDSQFFEPEKTDVYKFYVLGDGSQSFSLKYKSIPTRSISKHPLAGELLESNEYAVSVVPGPLHESYAYWDEIIDQSLVKITLAKGERWVFETSGAASPIELRVYDQSGAVIATNDTMGNASFDCRAAITATSAGAYYAGVRDVMLDVGDEAKSSAVTLAAFNCTSFPPADMYDPMDDVRDGASIIYAANASVGADIHEAGSWHGTHRLDSGDWYDCFALACRNGVTYALRAEYADEEAVSTLSLATEVYYLDDKKKKKTVKTKGTLTPSASSTEVDLTFTATQNRVYYVVVRVAEGVGLDYPAYDLRAMAYLDTGADLGLLQVKTKGADATWKLNKETLSYPNGAIVNIPSNSSTKVTFNAVSGFATPVAQTVSVPAGTELGDAVVVTGIYNDSYDSYKKTVNKKTVTVSDDEVSGAVTITGTSKTQTAKRTLWTGDPRDMFLFKASAGVYYNFKLVDSTLDGEGDALFTVSDAADNEVVAATNSVSKRLFAAGQHRLTVAHADPAAAKDTSYTLEYSAFNAGTVKFSAAKYAVKESAAVAQLTLKRSAKEGRLRVNYATIQGSSTNSVENAIPGSEYYPTNGIVEWASGDMKDKTITVRLIPDLLAKHETDKSFSVKIWPMDGDDIEEDEYPAQITLADAKVTITEATAAKPGTVSVTAYGEDGTPVANVKKPALSVTAGDDAVLTLSRTGGSDGRIAVKVSAAKGKKDTARAGTDFEAANDVIVWENGDAEDKEFIVKTLESTDLTASRTFTVSLAVQTSGEYKGYAKAALSAKSAAVTIKNSDLSKSLAAVQKEAKSAGATLTAKGTWYQDSDGNFRSTDAKSASVTFSVTGPGVFIVQPDTDGCGELACRVGSGETLYAAGGVMALAVPSGKQNIVFSYSDDTASGHPSFLPLDDEGEEFYRWVPFSKFAAYEPFSKSVVQPGTVTNLSWSVPAELVDIPMYYRVRHGLSSANVTEELGWTSSASVDVSPDLTAVPATTHYWALDFAIGPNKSVLDPSELSWTAGATWEFATAVAGAVTTDIALVDAYGNDYYDDEGIVMMETVRLVQGVAASFEIGPAGSTEATVSTKSRVYSGTLPPGLVLDGAAGKGIVSGVPTKAGTYTAVLQTATGPAKKPVWGSTITLRFEVEPIGTAAGTFNGTLFEDGQSVDRAAPSVGSVKLTGSAAGKLSAKVTIAGLSYTFTGNGFAEVVSAEDTEDGVVRILRAELTCKKTYSKVAYTSTMTVEMTDADTVVDSELGPAATVLIDMNVPDASQKKVTEDVAYTAELYRANTGDTATLAALDTFKGYYTVALVPEGLEADDGLPLGNGFLGVKVGEKGAVTVTGRRADGQAVSTSATAAIVGDPEDPSSCVLRVPFATSTSTACLGGVLQLTWGEDFPYVDSSDSRVVWGCDGSGSTEDGSGFLLDVVPVGGWFNTTENLQRHYLDYDFQVDGVDVKLVSNAVSLGSTKGETVSALTCSLNRATGIVSGTLTSYSEYQGKNVKKCPHYGIILYSRDDAAPLSLDVWSAGFFLRTATKTWKESVPFNILAEETDRDWSEATLPPNDGE